MRSMKEQMLFNQESLQDNEMNPLFIGTEKKKKKKDKYVIE